MPSCSIDVSPSEAGKKESPDHHLNPACQPCAEPSSISSFDCRLINARTADNGSAQNGSTNKSAKVVLVRSSLINARSVSLKSVVLEDILEASEVLKVCAVFLLLSSANSF